MPDLVRVKTPQGRHAHLRLEGNVSALCGSNAPFEPGGDDLPLCANCERRKERVRVGAVGQGTRPSMRSSCHKSRTPGRY